MADFQKQSQHEVLYFGVAESLRFLSAALLLLVLSACATSSGGLFGSSARPILATDEPHVGMGGIDVSGVNQGPSDSEAVYFSGTIENEPTNIVIPGDEVDQNIVDLNNTGAVLRGSPAELVNISFNNDSLKYVVEQLLGGLFSANYIISDEVQGTVSFKTETPVPRAAIPSIVRDILARNGYIMKVIDGVYQIGTPATIATLESNAAAGAVGDYNNRVITIKQGNIDEIAAVVAQILPVGATVSTVPSSNSLVLRISPADERAVMDLIRALVDNNNGDDLMAVIPVRESPPEIVAASIATYYTNSNSSADEKPLIIPLEDQQSLLVIARSERVMRNVRTLVVGLDKDHRDAASLRIIPLKNLPAEEIAAQLNQIFASGEASEQGQIKPTTPHEAATNDANEGGESVSAPTIMRTSPNGETDQGAAVAATAAGSGGTNRQSDQGISIVPDNRNNALLVYATFSQFKRIREVVGALDVPLAQVVIEATIVEVALNDNLKYGVQAFLRMNGLNLRSSQFSAPADSGEGGGTGIFQIDTGAGISASLVLEALQTATNVKVISSPYLTVLDGRAARLSVGDQIPYLIQQTAASQTGTTTTTNQVEVRDVGIILEVTPSIRADNSVLLNVKQEVSSAQATGSGSNLTPVISQRAISSDVVVTSGKTVLLGGLIQDRSENVTSGVPGVSDMPVIGNLFKRTENIQGRTELLVMITPRVVRSSLQLDNITQLLKSRSTVAQD